MTLTTTQRLVLRDIIDRARDGRMVSSPYQVCAAVATLRALGTEGVLECTGGSGDNSTWRLKMPIESASAILEG